MALPNLGCHVHPRTHEAVAPDLAAWGMDADAPLLICPGTPFKYAPEHDAIFTAIARRLPEGRLVFFQYHTPALSRALEARLRAAFAHDGLEFDRHAIFVPWQDKGPFFGLLGRARVFLDTIGFSGFNTALQAVQCGLPIVARDGRFLRGRLASGILRRLGLHELVATSDEAAAKPPMVSPELRRNARRSTVPWDPTWSADESRARPAAARKTRGSHREKTAWKFCSCWSAAWRKAAYMA